MSMEVNLAEADCTDWISPLNDRNAIFLFPGDHTFVIHPPHSPNHKHLRHLQWCQKIHVNATATFFFGGTLFQVKAGSYRSRCKFPFRPCGPWYNLSFCGASSKRSAVFKMAPTLLISTIRLAESLGLFKKRVNFPNFFSKRFKPPLPGNNVRDPVSGTPPTLKPQGGPRIIPE